MRWGSCRCRGLSLSLIQALSLTCPTWTLFRLANRTWGVLEPKLLSERQAQPPQRYLNSFFPSQHNALFPSAPAVDLQLHLLTYQSQSRLSIVTSPRSSRRPSATDMSQPIGNRAQAPTAP